MTEGELLTAIIGPGNNLCDLLGWRSFHVRPAWTAKGYRTAMQGSGTGFPDLVLVSLTPRPRPLLFRELKSDEGVLDDDQKAWRDALEAAVQDIGIWRPRDWDRIVEEMT